VIEPTRIMTRLARSPASKKLPEWRQMRGSNRQNGRFYISLTAPSRRAQDHPDRWRAVSMQRLTNEFRPADNFVA
jgi:hypothetical protein